jgi:hypothetical protein
MRASIQQASSRIDCRLSKFALYFYYEYVVLLLIENVRLSDLVATISKKPVPGHQKNLILEVTADDQSDEEVDIPYIMVKLK